MEMITTNDLVWPDDTDLGQTKLNMGLRTFILSVAATVAVLLAAFSA
jgi:hypothetical protein